MEFCPTRHRVQLKSAMLGDMVNTRAVHVDCEISNEGVNSLLTWQPVNAVNDGVGGVGGSGKTTKYHFHGYKKIFWGGWVPRGCQKI